MSIAAPSSQVRASMPTTQGSHHVRILRLRDWERQRRSILLAVSVIGVLLFSAGLLATLDFYFELAASIRLVAWFAITCLLGGLIWTCRGWLRFDSADAVCEAERAWPDIGQRLRTSHDYQMNPDRVTPANPELIHALEVETQQQVSSRTIQPLGRPWPIFAVLGVCAAVAIAWIITLAMSAEFRTATARLMFLPVHYSSIEMETLPDHMQLGEDLVVRVHVDGRPLDSAKVLYRESGASEWSEVALQPAANDLLVDDLSVVLTDRQRDLEVQVQAGHFNSGIHPIIVRIPLVLEQWKANVQPPAYTGLPASDGDPEGMQVPEGSRLEITAIYNRSPNEVFVELTPPSDAGPETQITDQAASFMVIAGDKSVDLSIQAKASDGMADESLLRVDVVPDRKPTLKFLSPEENAEAIATAELQFTLEAFDDYGLSTVGIRYRIDSGPEQTLWEGSRSEMSSAVVKTLTLPLEDLNASFPQALTYYAYAIDNREPEAQRVTSELRFVDIRPFSREYEFKDGQSSGNCQGECLTLEKLIKQQREILGRTFAATQQEEAANGTAENLAAQEDDLMTKTESLTHALEEKVGPMPSLQFAIRSMFDAIEHLRSEEWTKGQSAEERALADLIAARQNLRKILKQNDSQSQMCRNVDQQQLDKLRPPKRDQERQEAQKQDLAQLRQRLEQLAKQQQSFCQSAKACSQSGQSSQPASSSSDSNQSQANREQLVQQQQQAAAEAQQIQQELSQGDYGDLAPKRAEQAADAIQQSGESLAKTEADAEAIRLAEQAAEQLQQLSEHLARRHNPDFGDKLAAAARQAEQLADKQQALSRSLSDSHASEAASSGSDGNEPDGDVNRSASDQQQLAGEAEELVDLVEQLHAEATQQDWQVEQALREQAMANSPSQAAADMRKAAEHLSRGRTQDASQSGTRGAETMKRFATGLKAVQQAMGPAQLEQLTKAEEQAAGLLKDLKRAGSAAEQAMAEAAARQFAESLRPLAQGDRELIEAANALNDPGAATRRSNDAGDVEAQSPNLQTAPRTIADSLRQVDQVLQRRIQEAILSGSMQDTGAVPPQYSRMVEEYYRTLSEDVE